jgi:hypothetical protein
MTKKFTELPLVTSVGQSNSLIAVTKDTDGTPSSAAMTPGNFFRCRQATYNVLEYASLTAALTDIGATVAELEIPTTTSVSADLTVPANVTLVFIGSGLITVSSTKTLTINGGFFAPPRQVFSGAGTVILNAPGQPIISQWWNAKGDAKVVTDAAMTASSATLTSSSAAFTANDVGKMIDVSRVGASTTLMAIITGFTSTKIVTLSVPASYTGSSKTITLDTATSATGSMTAGSATLTSSADVFTSDDVGKMVSVTDVGAKNKVGTISAYTNSTTVTLSFSASVAATATHAVFGTNDKAAIASAIAALPRGGHVYFPKGSYAVGSALGFTTSNLTFSGAGMNASVLYQIGPLMLDSGSIFHIFDITQPASNIHFDKLGLSGTNWHAQTSVFGGDSADGVHVDTTGPMSNISAYGCRFDSFWGIGFHVPGSTGLTIDATDAVTNITVTDCQASFNSYDGLNPNPIGGLVVTGCLLHHNGTAGIECSTSDALIDIYAYHNFQGGASIGGFGGTYFGTDVVVRGVYKFNGTYGVAIGGNMRYCKLIGANLSNNGYEGVLLTGGTAAYNGYHTIEDCQIYSNSNIGIDCSSNNNIIRGCRIDSHSTGIVVGSGGDNTFLFGNVLSNHSSRDINCSAASLWLDPTNSYDPNNLSFSGSGSLASPVFRGYKALANNTATAVIDIALPTVTYTSGVITYRAYIALGGEAQVRSGMVRYSAVNKAGVYTTEIAVINEAASNTTGTLSGVWSIVAGTNKITLKFNANSSVFSTEELQYTIENHSSQLITPV